MNNDLRKKLTILIEEKAPIKATEIAATEELVKDYGQEIHKELEKMVDEGEIIEIEYVLPASSHRIKSLYFPKNTEISLKDLS